LKYVVDENEKSLAKNYDEKIDREEVQKVLNVLPEKFKSPLILYYMEDLTYQEISDYLDLPIGTVMSRLSRAKKHLKKHVLRVAKGLSLGRKVGQLASMLLIGGAHGL
ncbi:MAG: sigma-70 family RNA polymerase sigma factor, partial [Desulfobulbaceae bacterium]|nr:sigma-70 family RNA polymerase sigma factor [Desulfobulbaceae bacterium]